MFGTIELQAASSPRVEMLAIHPSPPGGGWARGTRHGSLPRCRIWTQLLKLQQKKVRADLQNQKLLHRLCTKLTALKTSWVSGSRLMGGSGLLSLVGNTDGLQFPDSPPLHPSCPKLGSLTLRWSAQLAFLFRCPSWALPWVWHETLLPSLALKDLWELGSGPADGFAIQTGDQSTESLKARLFPVGQQDLPCRFLQSCQQPCQLQFPRITLEVCNLGRLIHCRFHCPSRLH